MQASIESAPAGTPVGAARKGPASAVRTVWLPLWILTASGALLAAYEWPGTGLLAIIYLFALLQIAQAEKWRLAFYPGLAVGLLAAIGRLDFFWNIFSAGAVALWIVYAIWIALFTTLARACLRRFPGSIGWALLPFLWTGLEYFRSELYYLRFSWLSPGYAFGDAPGQVPFSLLGTYGVGFAQMLVACAAAWLWSRSVPAGTGLLVAGTAGLWATAQLAPNATSTPPHAVLRVAGVQMEFPSEPEVLVRLQELARKHPEAELLVLSEYTFKAGIPDQVREWCRAEGKFLVTGGKEPAPGGEYFNTAYVVDNHGEIVFQQAKSVPIQFFKDGLPAPRQEVWSSPWGRIGICICYDLSYTRVTDPLVRKGAQALIVPTMDVADWGKRQHELHARIAPVRAAEYGIPIFRLASSGISQAVNRFGRVESDAPFPGEGATLAAELVMPARAYLPLDRRLAPIAVFVTASLVLLLVASGLRDRLRRRGSQENPGEALGNLKF